jgi:methylmalonyl-CoA/ethylmalonyl-CoA epimerase
MTPQAAPLRILTSIGQIALTVTNVARATAFYRDILGLTFLFDANNMAFFDCGGTRLMLGLAEQPESTYSSIIYYRTDDIQKTANLLRGRGVAFESEPRMIAKMPDHELWMAFFRDSEGNLAGLMSEMR